LIKPEQADSIAIPRLCVFEKMTGNPMQDLLFCPEENKKVPITPPEIRSTTRLCDVTEIYLKKNFQKNRQNVQQI
jgi:hypothetical protein